ncbi:unnamed protein product [Rodentolepis nana]|uniref:Uncharacterized protein n=1 Tax=Rodentolepis nana TaxID=102285 RepID=A0A0R3T1X6_RODNA|nr:unnamed protein product [Rodentolepis nana]
MIWKSVSKKERVTASAIFLSNSGGNTVRLSFPSVFHGFHLEIGFTLPSAFPHPRTQDECFEVIPMLCRVKRISSRETRSETSAPPVPQRPLRGSRVSLASSSSAPPHGPIKPRVAPVVSFTLKCAGKSS